MKRIPVKCPTCGPFVIMHGEGADAMRFCPKCGERNLSWDTKISSRNRLPDRRRHYTQKLKIGGQTFHFSVGMYADGSPGELFVDTSKTGAAFRELARTLSVAVSIALQYGVPLEEYVEAFIGTTVEPAGQVESHDRIKYAPSFIDAIFRDLAIHFLGREDLAHADAAGRNEIAPDFSEPGNAGEKGENRTAGKIFPQSVHA